MVFRSFLENSGPVGSHASMVAMFVGIGCVTAFMVGGVYLRGRATWLAQALLFAAGFTGLWTVALSFTVEQVWAVAAGYGAAILAGIGLGAWRFAPEEPHDAGEGNEVSWIH